MRLFSMTVPTVAFEVSTSGEIAVTVAVSEIVANSSAKSTRAVCCTCNSISRVEVLNPSSSLFTVYGPGGNAGKSNRPTALLDVVRVALVALFTTVTVAPGITAPVASFTSPVIVPSVCAMQGEQRSSHVSPAKRHLRMGELLSSERAAAPHRERGDNGSAATCISRRRDPRRLRPAMGQVKGRAGRAGRERQFALGV